VTSRLRLRRAVRSRLAVRSRRAEGDRGAVAVIVAVLLASGVLLGMAAYAVDISLLYVERDQVVNAAGAVALAAAEECVRPGGTCGGGPLQSVADANAADGLMAVDQVCGQDMMTGKLAGCGSGGAPCITAPFPANVSFAEVRAGTRSANSPPNLLPPQFGRAVPGYDGTHVQACAKVAWGPPNVPWSRIALSDCQFDTLTGGITNPNGFWPAPPFNPGGGAELVLNLQGPQSSNCGGLGYLGGTGPCQATGLKYNQTASGSTNNQAGNTPVPAGCQGVIHGLENMAPGGTYPYLLMPIYHKVTSGANGNAQFSAMSGVAGFRVTGDKLSQGNPQPDLLLPGLPNNQFCGPGSNKDSRCLRGYFVWANVIDGHLPAAGWPPTYAVANYKTVG
jgi:hypothetical protein